VSNRFQTLLSVSTCAATTSVLHFFDARDGGIAAGPVASVELEDHLPPGLHGYWSTALHN